MQAILALEDGLVLPCRSFTGPGETSGEVIFNTGMTGYQEVLTDPSYTGQLVTMTYPHVGNYGINLDDVESNRICVAGFLVKECCKTPSNWRSHESLPDYLKRNKVVGVEGVDTRLLTRHLRIHGAKRGVISTLELDPAKLVEKAKAIPTMEGLNLAAQVTPEKPYIWNGKEIQPARLNADGSYDWPGCGPRLVVFDYGVKWNILRMLTTLGMDLLMVPASYTKQQVDKLSPDAVFLSSGPGDPATLGDSIQTIAQLADNYPLAGICLGHQLLGHALGGKTYKLKFGHHGCNHPVKEIDSGRIEISSQNHGFCVDMEGVENIRMTHVNLNDNTLEGFVHTSKPLMAIQFHPEACPGPHDSRSFFGRFARMVQNATGKQCAGIASSDAC